MPVVDWVCVRTYRSLHDADVALAALSNLDIETQLVGRRSEPTAIVPLSTEYVVMVLSADVEAAKLVLDEVDSHETPANETDDDLSQVARGPMETFARGVFATIAFYLVVTIGLLLTAAAIVPIASSLHATPFGYALDLPLPVPLLAACLALLFAVNRWLRANAIVMVPIVVLVAVVGSLHPRTGPASQPLTTPRNDALREHK